MQNANAKIKQNTIRSPQKIKMIQAPLYPMTTTSVQFIVVWLHAISLMWKLIKAVLYWKKKKKEEDGFCTKIVPTQINSQLSVALTELFLFF